MITTSTHDAVFLALKLGWDIGDDLYSDLDRFYKTQNITLSAAIQDGYLNLSWPTDNEETVFRLKYSEYL